MKFNKNNSITMGKALIIKGADFSQVAVDTIDIAVGVPTIAITILGQVTITSPNGEDIYYTTDGSTPTSASTKYTGAFSVQNGTTVKAVCYFGGNYSEVASQLYDGTLQAPSINITNRGVVTITATDNASIRYTTDGSTPSSSSGTIYSGAFNVENGVVVKAIAYISDGGSSIVSTVSSQTAVVPESVTFGFRLQTNGALEEDQTRWVSPKIPINGGQTYYWKYINGVINKDIIVEYKEDGTANEFWNISGSHINKTAKAGTTYLRCCGLAGDQYAGAYVSLGSLSGEKLFEYNGETE